MATWWSRYGGQTFYRVLMFLIVSAVVYSGYNFAMYMFRVDGGYSEWSSFTPCSATCGGGKKTRTRTCTKPVPAYGGKNCSNLGPSQETPVCNMMPCPINGGYSPWSNYKTCSKTCGGGQQTRTRECDNPAPLYGGKTCEEQELGPRAESQECNPQPCPVNGGYTEWGDWSECSATCGEGKKTRTRECTNPAPLNGGLPCEQTDLGEPVEEESCNIADCPIPTSPPGKKDQAKVKENEVKEESKQAEEEKDNEEQEKKGNENEKNDEEKKQR